MKLLSLLPESLCIDNKGANSPEINRATEPVRVEEETNGAERDPVLLGNASPFLAPCRVFKCLRVLLHSQLILPVPASNSHQAEAELAV